MPRPLVARGQGTIRAEAQPDGVLISIVTDGEMTPMLISHEAARDFSTSLWAMGHAGFFAAGGAPVQSAEARGRAQPAAPAAAVPPATSPEAIAAAAKAAELDAGKPRS